MGDLAAYLRGLDELGNDPEQQSWYGCLETQIQQGDALYANAEPEHRDKLDRLFWNWVRTEELKAWYGEREGDSLFQGTSVSALTIPAEYASPLPIDSVDQLEDELADAYIAQHDMTEPHIRGAILENVDAWMAEGAFYGITIGSKVIAQAFHLDIPARDVVFEIDGTDVDPHEITSCPVEIRERYFEICAERVECFGGLRLNREELEASLVLADISKPRLEKYRDRLILGPIRCNEICALLARNVGTRIRDKTKGRISPRSLSVTIFDTDTPYTYHQISGYYSQPLAPTLPGVTLLGTSGTIDAFRWLYAYRVSLVAQKLMKSSLYSEVARSFIPFVFFGVLVERDAEILLDLNQLDLLRYRGQISPYLEYCYLLPKLQGLIDATSPKSLPDELKDRLS